MPENINTYSYKIENSKPSGYMRDWQKALFLAVRYHLQWINEVLVVVCAKLQELGNSEATNSVIFQKG